MARTAGSHPANSGSTPGGVTKKEIESEVGAALAAHASADSAEPNPFSISKIVNVFEQIRTHFKGSGG